MDNYDLNYDLNNNFNGINKYFDILEGGLNWFTLKDGFTLENYILIDFRKFHYDKGYWLSIIFKDFSKEGIFNLIDYGVNSGNMIKYFKSYHFYIELFYYHRYNSNNVMRLIYCLKYNDHIKNLYSIKPIKYYETYYYNMIQDKVVYQSNIKIDEKIIQYFLIYIKINAAYILDIQQFFELEDIKKKYGNLSEIIYFQSKDFYYRALKVNLYVYRFIPYKLKNCPEFGKLYISKILCYGDYFFLSSNLLKNKKFILDNSYSESFFKFLKNIKNPLIKDIEITEAFIKNKN